MSQENGQENEMDRWPTDEEDQVNEMGGWSTDEEKQETLRENDNALNTQSSIPLTQEKQDHMVAFSLRSKAIKECLVQEEQSATASNEKKCISFGRIKQKRFLPTNVTQLVQQGEAFWEKSIFYSPTGYATGYNYVLNLPIVSLAKAFLRDLSRRFSARSNGINFITKENSDDFIALLYPGWKMRSHFFGDIKSGEYSQNCFFGFKKDGYYFTVRFTMEEGTYKHEVTLNLHINGYPDNDNGLNTIEELIDHLNQYYDNFQISGPLVETTNEGDMPDNYAMTEILVEVGMPVKVKAKKLDKGYQEDWADKDKKNNPSIRAGGVPDKNQMSETHGGSLGESKKDNLHKIKNGRLKKRDSLNYPKNVYVRISEGKIGRLNFEKKPIEICGLCTGEFTSGNILVFISADKTRYVLIYVDGKTDLQLIKDQIKWTGDGADFFLIKSGSNELTKSLLRKLKSEFPFREIPPITNKNIKVVSIVIGDDEPRLIENLPENLICHEGDLIFQEDQENDQEDEEDPAISFLQGALKAQFNSHSTRVVEEDKSLSKAADASVTHISDAEISVNRCMNDTATSSARSGDPLSTHDYTPQDIANLMRCEFIR